MKILAVVGSRNPDGTTAGAISVLLEGVAATGSQGEIIFLTESQIERCRQCEESGWGLCREEGRCVIEDEFAVLVNKLREAEAVVFATPVYFGDLSESMRAFLDRLRRITRHCEGKKGIAGKPAVGICVAGGGGGGAPVCAVSMEKVLSTCGFEVLDMVPVRRQNLEMKKDVLRTVGKWLTTVGSA